MNIIIFVITEYHLILAINEVLSNPNNFYEVYILKKTNSKRLENPLDFTLIQNAEFKNFNIEINLAGYFSYSHKLFMENLILKNYHNLIFFQELDPFLISVVKTLRKNKFKGKVLLFQDGLKPYAQLKGISLEMIKNEILIWKWLWRNKIRDLELLKLLKTKKYGHLKEVDELHLTMPEAYNNWNNKKIKPIRFIEHETYKKTLEVVFGWDDSNLLQNNNVILYLNQPMRQNVEAEINFLIMLLEAHDKKIILKLHPLTSQEQIQKFLAVSSDIILIRSNIPAEIFIMNLKNSIIISLNSTALLYHSPFNRYYYVSNLFIDSIRHLRRFKFRELQNTHIKLINSASEII